MATPSSSSRAEDGFVYKEYIPLNARVLVDYKAHEKVRFSYPQKYTYHKAVWTFGFGTVMNFWFAAFMAIAFSIGPALVVFCILMFMMFPPLPVPQCYDTVTWQMLTSGIGWDKVLIGMSDTIFVGFLLIGCPLLITYWLSLSKERMSTWLPKIGYWSAKYSRGINFRTFKPADVSGGRVVIPTFYNIFLHYKTRGDFNRYLRKVEVLEIPFRYYRGSFYSLYKWRKSYRNASIFRAVFYFTKRPLTGSMKVEFV